MSCKVLETALSRVILLEIKTFTLFNNTFLCIWGNLFGLMVKFSKKVIIFNIFWQVKNETWPH